MKLLLDTHTFIWWDATPNKLPSQILALCRDPSNEIILSIASVWEIQIKLQLGKLQLKMPLQEIIGSQQQTNNVQVLEINLAHVLALDGLPTSHKDPFDRLLVAQANIDSAALVSGDKIFEQYPVQLLW
jgi:PIN domain nuclease of toxin-antitoxin system